MLFWVEVQKVSYEHCYKCRIDGIYRVSDTIVTCWVGLNHLMLAKLNLSGKVTNDQHCADLIMITLPSSVWNMLH